MPLVGLPLNHRQQEFEPMRTAIPEEVGLALAMGVFFGDPQNDGFNNYGFGFL